MASISCAGWTCKVRAFAIFLAVKTSRVNLILLFPDLRNLLAQMTKSLPNTDLNADDAEVIDNLLKMKLKPNQVRCVASSFNSLSLIPKY
jgi:hypothetical protein